MSDVMGKAKYVMMGVTGDTPGSEDEVTVKEARAKLEQAIITWATAAPSERLRDGGQFFQPHIDAFERAVRNELARRFDEMAKQASHNVMMDNSHGPKAATWKKAAAMARGEIK